MFHSINASQKEEISEEMSGRVAKERSRSSVLSLANPWDWFCVCQEWSPWLAGLGLKGVKRIAAPNNMRSPVFWDEETEGKCSRLYAGWRKGPQEGIHHSCYHLLGFTFVSGSSNWWGCQSLADTVFPYFWTQIIWFT